MKDFMVRRHDFIVIGGGTAGCIMAARLSERAAKHVLLIEAGEDTPQSHTPADIDDIFPSSTAHPAHLWQGLRATVKAGQAPRPYPQGKVMGGGSSINGLVALRGQESDYERWVAAGADGWSWDDVLPWFRSIEHDQDREGPVASSAGDPIRHVAEEQWPPYVRAARDASRAAGFSFNRERQREHRRRILRHANQRNRSHARDVGKLIPGRGYKATSEPYHHGEYAGGNPSARWLQGQGSEGKAW